MMALQCVGVLIEFKKDEFSNFLFPSLKLQPYCDSTGKALFLNFVGPCEDLN